MTTPGVSGLKQTFTYDALNRLASATEKNSGGTTTWSETFGYDIYGNRWVSATTPSGLETAFTPTASSNFNSSNRLLNNGALYDLSGNQTTIGGYTSTFDAESRLATSTLNSITATYSYDGEDRRVQRVAGGVTTQYVYDAQGQRLAAEFSAQAPTVTGTEYLVADHIGSTRMATNSSGGCLEAPRLPALWRRHNQHARRPHGVLWNLRWRRREIHWQRTGCGDDPRFLRRQVPLGGAGEVHECRSCIRERNPRVSANLEPVQLRLQLPAEPN